MIDEMAYLLEEKTRKLENACRKINELQTKNLRLSVDNSRLIEDSIKAREILTRQAEMDVERDDLRRRLYDAELLIELMKDERYRANEKYESLYRHYKLGNELYLAENLRAEKMKTALRDIKINADIGDMLGSRNSTLLVWIRDTAEAALRTAEETNHGTHAKQFPNAVNADGDGDILFDIEASLRAKTEDMKRLLESQTLSPELASIGRVLVRLAEKSLGEVEE